MPTLPPSPIRTSIARALAAVVLIALPLSVRAADGGTTTAVLAASRSALGLDAASGRVRILAESGSANIAGVPGTARQWIDVRTGNFMQSVVAGPLSGDSGYDGTHVWSRDPNGIVWDDGSAEARYAAQGLAYLLRYDLWTPDRGGAAVSLEPSRTEGQSTFDVLSVTPPQNLAFEVWLDRATHLPVRMVQPIGLTTTTTTFADYRKVDGLEVPYVQRSSSDSGDSSLNVTAVSVNPPGAEVQFARPPSSAHDFSIAPGSSTTIPFELIDNHVYVRVMLNGKGPYRFIFDTGADYLLDTDVAKSLGIVGKGKIQGSGVGAATEGFSFAKVDTLAVGNATVRNQSFAIMPVRAGFGVAGGAPVDGLIGFGVLARFVTTFDYGNRRIVLTLPNASNDGAAAGSTTIPFRFQGTTPQIDCKIGGFAGACTVDTGSRLSLSVTSPFEKTHPSIVPANATAVGADGFGIGGAAMGRLGRTTLDIGSLTIPDTITDFTTQQKGAFANPFIAGNIGGGIWKRFAVTFDYPRQTMALVANANGPTADDYDRSGLFLIRGKAGIVVADARPGTPAALAGVVQSDVLASIDGRDVSGLTLAAVRDLFMAKAGTTYKLVVRAKDGATKTVALTLRDYV